MRGRLFNMPAIGRAVGFALVAAAIVAATLHFRHDEPRFHGLHVSPAASDPLTDELQRCQALAAQASDDAACEAAWAESRRFFTYQPAPSAASSPAASPRLSDR
jgi:conjugative transfer region protein TrbK